MPHSDDESALLDALESDLDSDPSLGAYRAQRLQQLHAEHALAKQLREQAHGTYTEINDEKDLMNLVTETKWCVVHFYKPGFRRCALMDGHLKTLAPPHIQTRFVRINVDNAPFLVTKLQIQVLPCVIAFVDSLATDRIVGFEGLGMGSKLASQSVHLDSDTFSTKSLESRLLAAGVLEGEKSLSSNGGSSDEHRRIKDNEVGRKGEDNGDDDEWD